MNKPEQAYPCPKCGVGKWKSCVYIKTTPGPKEWNNNLGFYVPNGPATIKGEPTKVSHNERLAVMHQRQRRRLWTLPVVPPNPAVVAFWEADRRDYRQMQDWLRENVRILL